VIRWRSGAHITARLGFTTVIYYTVMYALFAYSATFPYSITVWTSATFPVVSLATTTCDLVITWPHACTSGVRLESLQDGQYRLILYSRYNTVVWNSLRWGTALLLLLVGISTSQEVLLTTRDRHICSPGTNCRTVRAPSNQSSITGHSRCTSSLNFTRHFGTVCPCCQTNWSSSSSSSPW